MLTTKMPRIRTELTAIDHNVREPIQLLTHTAVGLTRNRINVGPNAEVSIRRHTMALLISSLLIAQLPIAEAFHI